MSRDWSSAFEAWGKPPSQTEQDEIARTERQIKEALDAHPGLSDKRIRAYGKGSHVRGTNVRRGSDVDVAVELRGDERTGDSWIIKKAFEATGLSDEELGLVSVDLGYDVAQLKSDVYDALVTAFGITAVTRKNKCIEVRELATTLPADVVPCRTTRRYDSKAVSNEGIVIRPDNGGEIVNWPKQDLKNGTDKNTNMSTRFKRAVRGVKALSNEMVEAGAITEVPSFMLECGVYNVPNSEFSSTSNYSNCLSVFRVMSSAIASEEYEDWVEVNELKYLFRSSQSWSVNDLSKFLIAAVDYLGVG